MVNIFVSGSAIDIKSILISHYCQSAWPVKWFLSAIRLLFVMYFDRMPKPAF